VTEKTLDTKKNNPTPPKKAKKQPKKEAPLKKRGTPKKEAPRAPKKEAPAKKKKKEKKS
jgi:hypothetical protein